MDEKSRRKFVIAVGIVAVTIIVVAVVLSVIATVQPRIIVAPFNGAIRMLTPRKPFYSIQEMREIYPESIEFEKRWPEIKEELLNAMQQGIKAKVLNM
jgi:hypothetical protein